MKTIFVHIGTPKTGTTHIQHYFSHNKSRLLNQGIYYLADRCQINAQGIAVALGFWEEHDPSAHVENMDWFRDEVKAALASAADRIVISTEIFCEALAHRRLMLIRRLQSTLASCGAERVVVVCYVRRQDIFVESRQAFDIARWGISPPVTDVDPDKIVTYADYYKLLSDYRTVFGDNMIVRPFEKSQMVNGDVLDDFLDVLDATRDPGCVMPSGTEHNSRLRGDLLEMVRVYNTSGLGDARDDYDFMTIKFLERLFTPEQLAQGGGKRFSRLAPAKRTAILRRYAASNRKVATEFLGRKDGKLFRDPVTLDSGDPNDGLGLQIEEITPLFMHMIAETFAHSAQLEKRLGALEAHTKSLTDRAGAVDQRVQAARVQADRIDQRAGQLDERHEQRASRLEAALREAQDRCARLEAEQRELQMRLTCLGLGGKKLVGWGTSAAFRAGYFTKPAPLAYLIDNDSKKWGRKIKGITVEHPGTLEKEHASEVVVIVYSSYFAEISTQIARYGNFTVIPSEVFAKYAVLPARQRQSGTLALAG